MAGIRDTYYTELKESVQRIFDITTLVIIVLFIGFAAMFGTLATLVISHFDSSNASYEGLERQVQAQNTQIQVLTSQLKNSTITPTNSSSK